MEYNKLLKIIRTCEPTAVLKKSGGSLMRLRIFKAVFKGNDVKKVVGLSDITNSNYENIYNGHLFCPNPECNARIIFVSGNKRTYFRTWRAKVIKGEIVNEHIEDCPYYVEHELEERAIRRTDPNLYYRLSADHIRRVLRNAYDRQLNPDKFKKKVEPLEGTTKRASSKSRIDNSLQPRGRAGLGVDGALDEAEKEPSIFRKSIDDVSEIDYSNIQCIYGSVEDIILDGQYPYITFLTKNNKNARVLFSEAFAVNNPAVFTNIKIYKQYIDFIKHGGGNPFICCIGKIIKDDYEVSIVIEDYRALDIDRKGYYEIVNQMMHN